MLLIALFARLRGFFQSGPLALSKCSSALYILALSLIPLLSAGIPISRALTGGILWQRVLTFSVIILVELSFVSLLAIFTAKLQQIQRNKTLNAFIRRQFILAIMTMLCNLWMLIVTISRFIFPFVSDDKLEDSVSNNWIHFIKAFALSLHVLFNFLCIALSYRCCDSLIVLFCGCLRCCRVIPITTEDHDAIFLEQIMRNSTKDKPEQAPTTRRLPTMNSGPGNSAPAAAAPPVIAMTQMPASQIDIVYEY